MGLKFGLIIVLIFAGFGFLQSLNSFNPYTLPSTTITLNPAVTYQKYLGWGGFLTRWDTPHMYYGQGLGPPLQRVPAAAKEQILNALFSELKLNSFTLSLRGGSMDPAYSNPPANYRSHEPHNDNANPTSIREAGLSFSYWPPLLETVKVAISKITARAQKPLIFLRVSGLEDWMNRQRSNFPEEYAEWITSLLIYFRDQHSVQIDYVSLVNEPDGIGRTTPDLIANMISALNQQLKQYSLRTKVAAPETVSPRGAIEYLKILEQRELISQLGLITYHIYDYDPSQGETPNLQLRRQLANFGKKYGIPLFMNEQSSDVKKNRRDFWLNTSAQAKALANDFFTEFNETHSSGMTCCMWTFWTDSSPLFGSDAFVILKFDQHNDYRYVSFERTKMFFVLGKIIRNLPPGSRRIQAQSTNRNVRVTAFMSPAKTRLIVFLLNNENRIMPVTFAGDQAIYSLNPGELRVLLRTAPTGG